MKTKFKKEEEDLTREKMLKQLRIIIISDIIIIIIMLFAAAISIICLSKLCGFLSCFSSFCLSFSLYSAIKAENIVKNMTDKEWQKEISSL